MQEGHDDQQTTSSALIAVALQLELGAFLSQPDRTALSNFAAAASALHSRLGGPQRRRQRARDRQADRSTPSVAQLLVLLRDVAFVAAGLRATCLVDCCALAPPAAARLLHAFSCGNGDSDRFPDLMVLALGGDVFFADARALLRRTTLALATRRRGLVLVDASAGLAAPRVVGGSEDDRRACELRQALEMVSAKLVDTVLANAWRRDGAGEPDRAGKECGDDGGVEDGCSNRVIALDPSEAGVSATALAGVLLGYPVIYDLDSTTRAGDSASDAGRADEADSWGEVRGNCLGTHPLFVVQTCVVV
ncbi:hypothetical protein PybrP1_009031 [[Pythium] brassicae (nom. inval.)]|nr:hypothetical protein PybrP1_009031 [[Pythium] brassicae (nom. inval.)]